MKTTSNAQAFIREATVKRVAPKAPPRSFTLRVSDETLERLRAAADRYDRSQHWVAMRALNEWLEKDENG